MNTINKLSHPFSLMTEDQTEQISGGSSLGLTLKGKEDGFITTDKDEDGRPPYSTMAVGEEGGSVTLALPEYENGGELI